MPGVHDRLFGDEPCPGYMGAHWHRLPPHGDDLRHGCNLGWQPQSSCVACPGHLRQAPQGDHAHLLDGPTCRWLHRFWPLPSGLLPQLRGGGSYQTLWGRLSLLCGADLHRHALLHGAQLRRLKAEQSQERPEPVLRPGHRLRNHCGWARGGRHLRSCLEPGGRPWPRLHQRQGGWLALALGHCGIAGRSDRGWDLPRPPARGVCRRCDGGKLGEARGRLGNALCCGVLGRLRPDPDSGPESGREVTCHGVLGRGSPYLHDLLLGQHLRSASQSGSHHGRRAARQVHSP
mmetsp:Transcript_40387/g.75209  ORF Transcript_40387/g.75209 Transcript_40387/m.75209 type:complete len:289 (+) Transcript_40387:258-1124(+)